MRSDRKGRAPWIATVLVALLLMGCSPFGTATVRVTEAQVELAAIVEEIVAELGFTVESTDPFFSPRPCTRVTGQEGAFTATTMSGSSADNTFRADAVAAILLAAGFELQRADRTVEVFGRRDGMWVTATYEPRRGLVSVDANTGCRAM